MLGWKTAVHNKMLVMKVEGNGRGIETVATMERVRRFGTTTDRGNTGA